MRRLSPRLFQVIAALLGVGLVVNVPLQFLPAHVHLDVCVATIVCAVVGLVGERMEQAFQLGRLAERRFAEAATIDVSPSPVHRRHAGR